MFRDENGDKKPFGNRTVSKHSDDEGEDSCQICQYAIRKCAEKVQSWLWLFRFGTFQS